MNTPRGQRPGPLPGHDREEEDDDGPWRHPPVAPRDADVADSFGKAVSDVVTGPLEGDPGKAKPAAPKPRRRP